MADAERMIFEGRVREGINVLNGLLYDEPGYASLHNYLGWAYLYHAKDNVNAEVHFRAAMRFAPDYAPPYLHMGNLMNRTARYSEAIAFFEAALEKPEAVKPALYEGIALALEMLNEYSRAIKAYKSAASESAVDHEVERMLKAVKRCRRKRLVLFFSF